MTSFARAAALVLFVWIAWTPAITVVALVPSVLACVTGGRVRLVAGVLEVEGGVVGRTLDRIGTACLTLGRVTFGINATYLAAFRAHERVHVRQQQIWGPVFFPAYFAGAVYARVRGLTNLAGNPFEIAAGP